MMRRAERLGWSGLLMALVSLAFFQVAAIGSAGAKDEAHAPQSQQPVPPEEMGINEYSDEETLAKVRRIFSQSKPSSSTTDHSKLKELQGPFHSGPEVTKACLSCHNKAGDQLSKNKHWTWEYTHAKTGQKLGKAHLLNNFCTNARGNEGMCAKCHAGYNRTGPEYDLTKQENMDCLVCHETTGTYYKEFTTEGNEACSVMLKPGKPMDYAKIAQSVAKPHRANCGKCHFYGGGGDNVKHGDLSSALFEPTKAVDVHMDAKGLDFACTTCHVGEGHQWDGSRYEMHAKDLEGKKTPGRPRNKASCESCHSNAPHPKTELMGIKLNGHVDKVACETCHIPHFAKGGIATMTDWDWSKAGKQKLNPKGVMEGFKSYEFDGYSYTQGDGHHRAAYKSIKGTFKYAENMKPTYKWFNGTMKYTTIDDKFDPAKAPILINEPMGDKDDPKARIWPFKPMTTNMPYDSGNNTFVYNHLWGNDDAAYWGNYDMGKSIKVAMQNSGKPYSGKFGYIETVSYWPINHMVSPKEDALACNECHSKNGRLAGLPGLYMPGRDGWKWMDIIGYLALVGALGGVLLHGLLRFIFRNKHSH